MRADGVALRILGDDLEDAAELAGLHHGAGFLDHRIAGVVVGQREDEAGCIDEFFEFLGFREGERHRLLADDVDAGFEEGLGDREVQVVAGDDGDEVDALAHGQRGLGLGHFRVGGIDA